MSQRDFVAEPDLESRAFDLEQRLAALTEEAAKNASILKNSQEREMTLLEASSLESLLRLLTSGLENSFRLEAISLVIGDPHHEMRHLLWSDGIRPDSIFGLIFVDAAQDILPPVASFIEPRLEPYNRSSHRRLFPQVTMLGSVALIPLLRQQKLVGSLNFGSADRDRFTQQHATDFLHRLACIASFCLENAVNRARLVRSGLTDVLTGMHNRRYLQDRLQGELASAQRTQTPLACLILDADHFKRVNDEHGHLAGDSVLHEIARRISSEIRANDIGARFGGEEFAVLLPGTSTEVAMRLAERIRETVARTPIELSEDQAVKITVSVGVSSVVPRRDSDDLTGVGERLLSDADVALYQAKSDGRNCVRENGRRSDSKR